MTTKHATDESVHKTTTSVDVPASDDTRQAEDASRELLAKARYDAFRLMTEARDEAETILDGATAEAGGIRQAADIAAKSTVDKAGIQAAEIVEAAYEEAAEIVAKGHRLAGEEEPADSTADLEQEHRELSERVSTLRVLADQLENRFAALADTARAEPAPRTDAVSSPVDDVATADDPSKAPAEPKAVAEDTTEQDAAPILDYSPSVAPPAKPTEDREPEKPERESFYNRRSAKLPRIGVEGGRGALDMTRSIREALDSD